MGLACAAAHRLSTPPPGARLTPAHHSSPSKHLGMTTTRLDGPARAEGEPTLNGARDAVIQLDQVVKRFGRYVAVHEADFTIGRGEFFSLLGPSGCGKTTTLRMIAGFEQPTGGRILLEGQDVSRIPPYRRNVNTVFQHYALFPHMTVYDNVAFGPRCRKLEPAEIERRVRALLAVVRLTRFRRAPAGAALRRAATAGGAGASAGQLSQRPPAGRAARRPRSQAPAGDADRAQADPARGGDHLHLRDPRPGRSADHVRPDRRDERRSGGADRSAAGDLSLAGVGVRRQFHRRRQSAPRQW